MMVPGSRKAVGRTGELLDLGPAPARVGRKKTGRNCLGPVPDSTRRRRPACIWIARSPSFVRAHLRSSPPPAAVRGGHRQECSSDATQTAAAAPCWRARPAARCCAPGCARPACHRCRRGWFLFSSLSFDKSKSSEAFTRYSTDFS